MHYVSLKKKKQKTNLQNLKKFQINYISRLI